MPMEIRPFSTQWRIAVREFNGRLEAAGVAPGLRLPEDPQAEMLPGSQLYLAVEEGTVRGGYVLRPQPFSFHGTLRRVTHLRLPLSEGVIHKSYAHVGPLMLRSALKAEPVLYALGMGGDRQPLPRMLQAMGWSLSAIPFFFRVAHPARFLRQIRAARQSQWRAAIMDLAAWTGAGWLGIHAWQRSRTRRPAFTSVLQEAQDFGAWADEVWQASRGMYGMAAVRDAATLRQLYPASDPRFLRLQVSPGAWAVLLDTAMRDDLHFGDLRVGTIADCMGKPEDAATVIHAARLYLERRGVDLIISNQSHPAWVQALAADGFLRGPSNFLLGASKALSELLAAGPDRHMNRGDGDGPVHL
jgi:hypothetical protein